MNITQQRRFWLPDTVLDPRTLKSAPVKGMELVDLKNLGMIPGVFGGALPTATPGALHGFHHAGDVVTQTADGRDLNSVWVEFLELINAVNSSRQALINFLTYSVTQDVEQVTQAGAGVDFEESSEFGVPVASRVTPAYFNMAYDFKWYDLGTRYTWQYLANATEVMVNSVANAAVEAYYRLQLFKILKTVFNASNLTATINGSAYNVYKFYNNDGTVPPTYKTNTFLGTHQHYRTTGAATLNAGDLDEMLADFKSHGYDINTGYRQVLLAHSTQTAVIRTFRSVANGGTGAYDFIPAANQPGQLITVNQTMIGQSPVSPTLNGLTVVGTYGPLIIVEEDWMPTTHIFGFNTGGEQSFSNPVGVREHANQGLRGLRLIKGKTPDYPLIDSYWAVGFGTGIRHRGAGMVMEITTDATYDPPAIYA